MNREFIEELEILKCKQAQLLDDIKDLEDKYSYMDNYKLVSHFLAKAGITYMETTEEALQKENAIYECIHREDGKIIIRLIEVSSYE